MNTYHLTGFDQLFSIGNTPAESDELAGIVGDFMEALPHGSGIDCDWGGHMPVNGRYVYFTNSYHVMNENGYYVGYQDFTIFIDKHDFIRFVQLVNNAKKCTYEPSKQAMMERSYHLLKLMADEFTVQFNNGQYLADKHMLREYLEDIFHYALSESIYDAMAI